MDSAKKMLVAVGLAAAALSIGCATTEMTNTWTDPSAKGAAMSKIAVICLAKDPGLRRIAEDATAAQMGGTHAVPSYQVLDEIDLKDREAVKSRLNAAGFDGVLVMRLAAVSEHVTAYNTFDSYYAYGVGTVYGPGPGEVETNTIVHIVSNLYSLEQNKLVWSGTSKTFDPQSARQAMTDVGQAVAKSLQKDRIIL
ncbi:MAG TPA: hypothetical protein VKQ32_24755 [Polyangia bacterium]|nr:hypothetical protein [Polyangia bacterium]